MGNHCCTSGSSVVTDNDATSATVFPKREKVGAKARSHRRSTATAAAPPQGTSAPSDHTTSPAVSKVGPSPPPAPKLAHFPAAGGSADDCSGGISAPGHPRRHRHSTVPRQCTAVDELVTDTLQISATTVSEGDEDEDCFSVDVSVPTHNILMGERLNHPRTYSDATSEVDYTAASLDRPRGLERVRGLTARELVTMEAERRGRVLQAAQAARRVLWKTLCKEQAMDERAAMLQRFFLERLALMLWETVAQETVARAQVTTQEDAAWVDLQEQQLQSLEGAGWPPEDFVVSLPVAPWRGSSQCSQHACDTSIPGTRANGATTDVDLTSNSSFDDEDGSGLLRPTSLGATPPTTIRVAHVEAKARPSTAPSSSVNTCGNGHRNRRLSSNASDDLATSGSASLDRSHRSAHRGQSPVASDPRRILREKCVAKVESTVSAGGQRR